MSEYRLASHQAEREHVRMVLDASNVRESSQLGQAMSNRFSYSSAATCLACVIAFAPQAFAQSTPLYSVTKTVALGAPDRWDFVVFDATSHKVFVAHGDRVTVVDGRTGKMRPQRAITSSRSPSRGSIRTMGNGSVGATL